MVYSSISPSCFGSMIGNPVAILNCCKQPDARFQSLKSARN